MSSSAPLYPLTEASATSTHVPYAAGAPLMLGETPTPATTPDAAKRTRFLWGAGISFALALASIGAAVYMSQPPKKGLGKVRRVKFKRATPVR